ncbi:MAG: hypothetical protein WD270_06250 [Acetobacterales bacterium]
MPLALVATLMLAGCEVGDLPTHEEARRDKVATYAVSPSVGMPPPPAAYAGPTSGPDFRRRDEATTLERPIPQDYPGTAEPVPRLLDRAADERMERDRAERAAEFAERRARQLELRREAAEEALRRSR